MDAEIWTASITATLACVGTLGAAWLSNRKTRDSMRAEIQTVRAQVAPVSNGFAKSVMESLLDIKGDLGETKGAVTALTQEFRRHLDSHS